MSEKRPLSGVLEGSDLMGFDGAKSDSAQGSARTSTAKFDKDKPPPRPAR